MKETYESWHAPLASWWLGATAAVMGDAPALTTDGERIGFAELAAAAERVAAALAGAGISRGDRVAVVAPASRRVVELVHAAQRVGATVVPLSHRATPTELAALVGTTRPKLTLVADALVDELVTRGSSSESVRSLSELDRLERRPLAPPAALDPTSTHSLVCTSGTTGSPKAIALSHANHYSSAIAAAQRLDYRAGQCSLAVLPLHHVGGLAVLLRSAIFGAEVVLRSEYDAAELARMLGTGDVAHASLVPTMLHRLLPRLIESGDDAGARACCFLIGGAALGEDLAARAHAAGLDVRGTYGMTETASQVATSERGELHEHPGTSGRALDGVELGIDAPDAEGFGELKLRGPQVAGQCFDAAGRPQELLRDDWLYTGDVARIDEHGRLFVGSRRVDLIVSGGENVRPEEVERVLAAHPSVAEAGVYGVSDAEWGQRVAAVVVPCDGARIEPAELVAWCRSRLASHKLPRVIDVAQALPRTASGKLRRRKLAAGG
jgi:O-succinylbenzoic acid--CoA ligase